MKTYTTRIVLLSLITAGLILPVLLRADDTGTNAPDTSATQSQETTPATPKHARHGAQFRGTLDSMDTNAMTLTVGSQTFKVTHRTKITNNGEPATLADGVIGAAVRGSYRTNDDGDLVATRISFGHGRKKKETSDDSTSTNSAAN